MDTDLVHTSENLKADPSLLSQISTELNNDVATLDPPIIDSSCNLGTFTQSMGAPKSTFSKTLNSIRGAVNSPQIMREGKSLDPSVVRIEPDPQVS